MRRATTVQQHCLSSCCSIPPSHASTAGQCGSQPCHYLAQLPLTHLHLLQAGPDIPARTTTRDSAAHHAPHHAPHHALHHASYPTPYYSSPLPLEPPIPEHPVQQSHGSTLSRLDRITTHPANERHIPLLHAYHRCSAPQLLDSCPTGRCPARRHRRWPPLSRHLHCAQHQHCFCFTPHCRLPVWHTWPQPSSFSNVGGHMTADDLASVPPAAWQLASKQLCRPSKRGVCLAVCSLCDFQPNVRPPDTTPKTMAWKSHCWSLFLLCTSSTTLPHHALAVQDHC